MSLNDSCADLLKCPITYELFRDPVIGSDGHTYERKNITEWIRRHGTSPITRQPMELNSLRPNITIKRIVNDFLSSSVEKQYRFHLNVDICKAKAEPIVKSSTKQIYEGRWMKKNGPSIILIQIDGTRAKHEASFYVKLSCHPHIVRTYGLVESDVPDSIILVQEYAPERDLAHLFRHKTFQPTIEVLLEIFCQIASAMICLADNQIVHGDLACRNVLVFRISTDRPSEILVKLTDFGLTRTSELFTVLENNPSITNTLIPVHHAAPEIIAQPLSTNYSEKSDVYSFGILMWEACSKGKLPYEDLKTLKEVCDAKREGRILEKPTLCSDELWMIINNCLQNQPGERPTFKSINDELTLLKFQYRKDLRPDSVIAKHSSTGHVYQSYNPADDSFSDDELDNNTDDQQTYTNLPSRIRDLYINQKSNDFMICKYCLEHLEYGNRDKHAITCHIGSAVKKVVQRAIQLSPLELTSCSKCDEIIPITLSRIHQNYCAQTSIHRSLQNPNPTVTAQSLGTYLRPTSIPITYSEIDERSDQSSNHRNDPNTKPMCYPIDPSNSRQLPSHDNIDLPVMISKSSKTSLNKKWSKFKKKFIS